jgi:pimeloyl-ACP methyl ester carboxylesterase
VSSAESVDAGARTRLTEFRSLDGLLLRGSVVIPVGSLGGAAVLVHGGGVTRDEGGFFTRLADGLAGSGVASLRFDLRGHGQSEGRQEELTLSGIVNDIRAAVAHARDVTGSDPVDVIGVSFSGGISALFASRYPDQVRRLVLLNPLIDYKKRFIDDKPYWSDDRIDETAGRELAERGFLAHSPTFKLGRPLLNEIFQLRPDRAMGEITTPTLVVHGTRDTFIPVDSSRTYVQLVRGPARLLEIDGAQHGFAVHDDPQYADPQTGQWQAFVIRSIAEWLSSPHIR